MFQKSIGHRTQAAAFFSRPGYDAQLILMLAFSVTFWSIWAELVKSPIDQLVDLYNYLTSAIFSETLTSFSLLMAMEYYRDIKCVQS